MFYNDNGKDLFIKYFITTPSSRQISFLPLQSLYSPNPITSRYPFQIWFLLKSSVSVDFEYLLFTYYISLYPIYQQIILYVLLLLTKSLNEILSRPTNVAENFIILSFHLAELQFVYAIVYLSSQLCWALRLFPDLQYCDQC